MLLTGKRASSYDLMMASELNKTLTRFLAAHAELLTREEFLERFPYFGQ
jgi:hypothetical protein